MRVILYRVAQKNATLTINNFKKTRDRMKKLCALLRIKFFSQQDDTKIVNFDEAVLILCPFFCFSEAMSFSRFALLSQKSQFTYRKVFHCLASPAGASIHYSDWGGGGGGARVRKISTISARSAHKVAI